MRNPQPYPTEAGEHVSGSAEPNETPLRIVSANGTSVAAAHRRLLPLPRGSRTLDVESDGTLVYGDGQCRAMLAVDPLTLDALAPEEQSWVCAHFARVATMLAAGQSLQLLVESTPLPADEVVEMVRGLITTPHPALRTLAARSLEHLSEAVARAYVPAKRGYLIIGPPPAQALGLSGALQGTREALGFGRRASPEPDRHGLDGAVEDVLSLCQAMGLRSRRLGRAEVLSLLWRSVHPGASEPADLTGGADLVAALAPVEWQETYDAVCGDGVYTRSLYVLEPPDLTSAGWLDELVSLDTPLRLSWHIRGRDRDDERARQLKRRKRFTLLARGQRGLPDPDTEDAGAEAEALADDLLSATVGIVASTLVVTLQATDLESLDRATERAVRLLRTRLSAPFGRGRGHQRALWRASLPFGVDAARRARRWHTTSIGHGLPFLAHSPGMERGFPVGFTTTGGELVPINLSDPSLPNWVVTVLGRQGSGKTFLTQLFTLWTLYQGGRATVIDRAGHYRTLIDLVGGAYIALGKEAAPRTINLWDLRPGEELRARIEMVRAAHEILLCAPGQVLDPRTDALLERAIRQVYSHHRALVAVGEQDAASAPLERDLVAVLAEWAEAAQGSAAEREIAGHLRDCLQPYVGEGRYAHLVDRPTTVDILTPLLCFDLDRVPARVQPLVMFTISYAMAQRATNTYEQRAERHPELLAIDEGWYMTRYAGAALLLDDMARRSRHMALRFIFTTQQLSDLIDNPGAVAIFNAASMKCLFRQQDARSASGGSTIEWLASQLQISLPEARRLTQLGTGQMLFVREGKDGANRRGVVDVRAGPYEYWVFTSEPEHDVPAKLAALAEAGGDTWTAITRLVAEHGR